MAGTTSLCALPSFAASVNQFPASLQVQGVPLRLNGTGTRYKTIFKVYDMALYTAQKVSTSEEALRLTGPVRLSFVALRELPGTDLGRLFIRGLSDNSPKDVVNRHTLSSNRLVEIFSGKSKLLPGDSFAMEYQPSKGIQFFISEQSQGAPVGDLEFFRAVLKIWLGQDPADFMLKDALLGIAKS